MSDENTTREAEIATDYKKERDEAIRKMEGLLQQLCR